MESNDFIWVSRLYPSAIIIIINYFAVIIGGGENHLVRKYTHDNILFQKKNVIPVSGSSEVKNI